MAKGDRGKRGRQEYGRTADRARDRGDNRDRNSGLSKGTTAKDAASADKARQNSKDFRDSGGGDRMADRRAEAAKREDYSGKHHKDFDVDKAQDAASEGFNDADVAETVSDIVGSVTGFVGGLFGAGVKKVAKGVGEDAIEGPYKGNYQAGAKIAEDADIGGIGGVASDAADAAASAAGPVGKIARAATKAYGRSQARDQYGFDKRDHGPTPGGGGRGGSGDGGGTSIAPPSADKATPEVPSASVSLGGSTGQAISLGVSKKKKSKKRGRI